MTQKHTPEPWAMSTKVDGNWWHISAGNQAIAAVHAASKKRNEPYASMFEANARRIVACVNAMAGIGDDNALFFPGNSVRSVISNVKIKELELEQQRDHLQAQVDELLAALVNAKEALECCYDVNDHPGNGSSDQDKAIAIAAAAITKITGETK